MDEYTRERRFARCYALWAAATNYRRHTTASAAKTTVNRSKAKANALTALAEALLITAAILAGLAGFYLLADTSQPMAAILCITTALGANTVLEPVLTAAFGPVIDRLNAQAADTDKTEANV